MMGLHGFSAYPSRLTLLILLAYKSISFVHKNLATPVHEESFPKRAVTSKAGCLYGYPVPWRTILSISSGEHKSPMYGESSHLDTSSCCLLSPSHSEGSLLKPYHLYYFKNQQTGWQDFRAITTFTYQAVRKLLVLSVLTTMVSLIFAISRLLAYALCYRLLVIFHANFKISNVGVVSAATQKHMYKNHSALSQTNLNCF